MILFRSYKLRIHDQHIYIWQSTTTSRATGREDLQTCDSEGNPGEGIQLDGIVLHWKLAAPRANVESSAVGFEDRFVATGLPCAWVGVDGETWLDASSSDSLSSSARS